MAGAKGVEECKDAKVAMHVLGAGGPLDPAEAKLLLYYLLVLTVLTFYARYMSGPFLPIVLVEDFHQTESIVGLVTAAFPIASLIATPRATRLASQAASIFEVHFVALLGVAASNAIFVTLPFLKSMLGSDLAVSVVIAFRVVQGFAFAAYLAANTTLIMRTFPRDIPYILALMEVAVGVGCNLGRVLGGLLFDWGGIALPFCSIAIFQGLWTLLGYRFRSSTSPASPASVMVDIPEMFTEPQKRRWDELLMRRVILGMAAVALCFFQTGFYDATLGPYLMSSLKLDSTRLVSYFYALRSTNYLWVSFVLAMILKRQLVSLEMLICIGATLVWLALTLAPSQGWVLHALTTLADRQGASAGLPFSWLVALQALGVSIGGCGPAFLFVPALPLMQSEVQHLGQAAVEQTTALFMSMISLGEASGPFLGGCLVERLGYSNATLPAVPLCIAVMVSALCLRNAKWDAERHQLVDSQDKTDTIEDVVRIRTATSFSCENSLARQIVETRLVEGSSECEVLSAPATIFRRPYSPLCMQSRRNRSPDAHAPRKSLRWVSAKSVQSALEANLWPTRSLTDPLLSEPLLVRVLERP